MTHKLTIKDKEYLLIEVKENINKFVIKNYGYAGKWLEGIEDSKLNSWKVKIDNENTYQIINTISNLTEEECSLLVKSKRIKESWNDVMTTVYLNYDNPINDLIGKYVKTAKQSFISLLKSKNILAKSFIEIPLEPQIFKEMRLNKFEQELKEYQNLPDDLLLLIQINN